MGVRADNGHNRSSTGPAAAVVAVIGGVGGCWTIRCALVPLIPNEEIAAVRGCSESGHGIASVSNRTAPVDQSICGLG
ncbi:hypothetical protein MSIMFI_05583 [Mycobacterium simulans]|nr:hypothetical protein MSIMFI_05583 [Mycobacterium simulans]